MEKAKELLQRGWSAVKTAEALSYTPRGFRKAVMSHFGVLPSQLKEGKTGARFVKEYEYRYSEEMWGKGQNPTPDGLWEFAYFRPDTGEYGLMEWDDEKDHFQAPSREFYDPYWYCLNRDQGYGMHPGKVARSVRTFHCPHSGTAEIFFSVGRNANFRHWHQPTEVHLYRNGVPLQEPVVLRTFDPIFFTATLPVKKGDLISLHLGHLGNHRATGVHLYRQRIAYLELTEE